MTSKGRSTFDSVRRISSEDGKTSRVRAPIKFGGLTKITHVPDVAASMPWVDVLARHGCFDVSLHESIARRGWRPQIVKRVGRHDGRPHLCVTLLYCAHSGVIERIARKPAPGGRRGTCGGHRGRGLASRCACVRRLETQARCVVGGRRAGSRLVVGASDTHHRESRRRDRFMPSAAEHYSVR